MPPSAERGFIMNKRHDDMTIIENSIIPIYEKNCIDGSALPEQGVNARELWEALESKQEFANWIKDRVEKYGFTEGGDYLIILSNNNERGRPKQEYVLTLDVAKEIAMVENNDKGRMIRRYFIEAEKRYRELKLIRARSKAERRLFTDIIKEILPETEHKAWMYKNFTDLIYKHVTGYSAKRLREMYDKPPGFNVRELLTPQQVKRGLPL
jgi:phage anti-repressor protein